jgi:hypothetical protein
LMRRAPSRRERCERRREENPIHWMQNWGSR